MMYRLLFICLVLLPFKLHAEVPVIANSDPLGELIPLDGLWLFHEGDSLSFATPEFDDRNWTHRILPTANRPWSQRWRGYGWYRLHVDISPGAIQIPRAIVLGPAQQIVQAYVNGLLVAERGHFQTNPLGGDRTSNLYGVIQPGLFRPGDNVIAIRVLDTSWNGGIPYGPLALGRADQILPYVQSQSNINLTLRVSLAILALILGLSHMVTVFGPRSTREGWWLMGTGLSLAVVFGSGTGLFETFLPNLELVDRLPILAALIGVLCLGHYFAARFDDWGAVRIRIGRNVLLLLAAIYVLVPEVVVFLSGREVLFLTAMVTALYIANLLSKAARRQDKGALPVFFSVVLLALLLILDGFRAQANPFLLPPFATLGALGVLLVTSVTNAVINIKEQEKVLSQMLALRQQSENQIWMNILDATTMSITHPDDFLDAVIHEAARELEVRRCSLILRKDSQLRISAAVGLPTEMYQKSIKLENSIAGWCFLNRQTVSSTNLPAELQSSRNKGGYQSNSFICQPVQYAGNTLGVLNVTDRNDGTEFSFSHEIAVGEVADKLALVLTRLGRSTDSSWQQP